MNELPHIFLSLKPQVFTTVTYGRLAPDPILANQLLNCCDAETAALRQMQLLKIQVCRGPMEVRPDMVVATRNRCGRMWKMSSSTF